MKDNLYLLTPESGTCADISYVVAPNPSEAVRKVSEIFLIRYPYATQPKFKLIELVAIQGDFPRPFMKLVI